MHINLEETIFLKNLTSEQKKSLDIWMPDMKALVLVYPKKIFWFCKKNVPIVDENNQPIIFISYEEALDFINKVKQNDGNL